jgi:hypothetical protein
MVKLMTSLAFRLRVRQEPTQLELPILVKRLALLLKIKQAPKKLLQPKHSSLSWAAVRDE